MQRYKQKCMTTVLTGAEPPLTESTPVEPQQDSAETDMNEKLAIDKIQKSLMRDCETVSNPTSSTITMPGTPPAYSTSASFTVLIPIS